MIKMSAKTLVYPLKLTSKHTFKKLFFGTVGKKLMLYLFTKKKVKIF